MSLYCSQFSLESHTMDHSLQKCKVIISYLYKTAERLQRNLYTFVVSRVNIDKKSRRIGATQASSCHE